MKPPRYLMNLLCPNTRILRSRNLILSFKITHFSFSRFLNFFFLLQFQFKAAIPPSGACLGSILSAFLLRRIGRKYTIVLASPFATIGWILIATATRYETLIGARFLTGFCVGLCLPAAQVYVH